MLSTDLKAQNEKFAREEEAREAKIRLGQAASIISEVFLDQQRGGGDIETVATLGRLVRETLAARNLIG